MVACAIARSPEKVPKSSGNSVPKAPVSRPSVAAAQAPTAPFVPLELTDAQLKRACRVQPIIAKAAQREGLDPNLLNAIVWLESKFEPKAQNRSGARGLMQLMPGTSKAMAKALGRSHKPFDPDFNIQAGAHLLRVLLDKFDGDERLALFGYARGSGRARAWQSSSEPLPEGVRAFLAKVERGRRTFSDWGLPSRSTRVCQTSSSKVSVP